MNKRMQSNIMLFITAIIWGSAFVAQKAGTVLEPFTYNGIRTFIGGIFLIPIIYIMQFLYKKYSSPATGQAGKSVLSQKDDVKITIIGGISCGTALFVASTLQQFGLAFGADAGKTGFITTLYIVIVPILGLFLKHRVKPLIWGCVALAVAGFYFLSIADNPNGFTIEIGDFFVLLCAFAFACHILVIDHFSPKCDGVKLSCVQFLFAGMLGIICMFVFENPNLPLILETWGPILYAGVVSSGVAYTLQVVAQKHAEPTTASLILSTESVFAVLFGMLILSETLSLNELIGCGIILVAVLLPQFFEGKESK